jgi:starch phosphorylase
MKAALNGVLHCSILDGWWAEAYNGQNGWAIGRGEMLDDDEQDAVDSATFYDILEYDIVPRFYNRNASGVPTEWMRMMKENIRSNAWRYAAERMVSDYSARAYTPAIERGIEFLAHNASLAREVVEYEQKLQGGWHEITIVDVVSGTESHSHVGDPIHVRASIQLGQFSPSEIIVQLISGPVSSKHEIQPESIVMMNLVKHEHQIAYYAGDTICASSGFHGCTVRVLPNHRGYPSVVESGFSRYPNHA